MKISVDDIRRIELIPENDEEKAVCQEILDNKIKAGTIYWGDAGENFSPPEFLGGLILNTYVTDA